MRHLLPAILCLLIPTSALAEYQLEIGPDTTVIDGPVNPDGTINYLAYLNEKLSAGVRPENNFAVDVVLTLSDEAWPSDTYRQGIFEKLGLDKHQSGTPFLGLVQFVETIEETDFVVDEDVKNATTHHPWSEKEYPLVKQWLDNQAEVIDHLVEATRKQEFYFPFQPEDGMPEMLACCPFPWLGHCRGIAWALAARAQWRVGQGDLEGAWSDAQALHRLAWLNMNQGLALSWVVGVSIENHVNHVVPGIASSSKLTPDLSRQIIGELNHLESPICLVDTYHDDARLGTLDLLMHFWKGRLGYYKDMGYIDQRAISLMMSEAFDPNPALREINRDVDRLIQASRIGDYQLRQEALVEYEQEREEIKAQAVALLEQDPEVSDDMGRRIRASNVTTAIATALFLCPQKFFTEAEINQVQTRHDMQCALAPVALAIGGYHAEHGEYPPDLQALVPAYLDSLPTDFATGKLPVYRIEDGAAIVYSLGTDLEDDDGLDDVREGTSFFVSSDKKLSPRCRGRDSLQRPRPCRNTP